MYSTYGLLRLLHVPDLPKLYVKKFDSRGTVLPDARNTACISRCCGTCDREGLRQEHKHDDRRVVTNILHSFQDAAMTRTTPTRLLSQ